MSIREIVQEISKDAVKQIQEKIEIAFENDKEKLSTARLLDEKTKEVKTQKVDITLDIKYDNKDKIVVNIKTASKMEDKVLKAQYRGTGYSVSEDILKFFGFKKEQINEEIKKQKYFDPNGADIHFVEKIRTLIGGKPKIS